ncbi:MAG: HNH endonuclease [Planctomycetota bacterium]|nr:HNH endonuclease [Planctomycetota bacterium]
MGTDDYHSTRGQAGSNGSALAASVLVLNRSYVAIHVISAKRAFSLLMKDAAEIVTASNGSYASYDFESWIRREPPAQPGDAARVDVVRTPSLSIEVPRVVRLHTFDKVPQRKIRFCRRNVLNRDECRCQYCGKKMPASQLSIDHVVPKSLGGRSVWTNVVAACSACNARKGGQLLHQAQMRLIGEPVAPKNTTFIFAKAIEPKYGIWRDFIGKSARAGAGESDTPVR